MTRAFSRQAILLCTVFALLAWMTAPALAAPSAGPAKWLITSAAGPAHFKPGDERDLYIVSATNVGGEATSGTITIKDSMQGKAEATEVQGSHPPGQPVAVYGDAFTNPHEELSCELTSPSSSTCSYTKKVDPGDVLTFAIRLKVSTSALDGETITNTATVSGGGAEEVSTSEPTTEPTPVSSEPVPFGIRSLLAVPSTSQAGAHPNFTTSFTTNWSEIENQGPVPPGDPRDIGVDLPPGLSGDPLAVPRCDLHSVWVQKCPEDTAVGVALTRVRGGKWLTTLVYNIVPYANEPAAFAFSASIGLATARLDTSVRPGSNGEYTVHVSVSDINEAAPVLSSSVTLWGVPALHNGPREDKTTECEESTGYCRTFGGPEGVEREGEATEKSTIVNGLSSTAGIFKGSIVSGGKIAPATVVSEVIGEHEVKLSNAVEKAGSATLKENLSFVVAREGEVTEKSTVVKELPFTTGIVTGSVVSGAKVAAGTVVSKVIGEHEVELSSAVEGTESATLKENLTFSAAEAKAFMRNPTSCGGPLAVELETRSWQEPGVSVFDSASFPTPVECSLLSPLFTPSFRAEPDSTQAGAPTGYTVTGEASQSQSPETLATPDLKDATVTLPVGTVASPSAANGLEACSDAQFNRASVEPAQCPLASEVGTVKIKTPLVKEELTGQLFLGQPECSPCEATNGQAPAAEGKLVRLFIQAELREPGTQPQDSAVRIKLAGRTHVNEQNGQLTTVFENNPQQPFEKLTLHTDGGPLAPLANPSTCGTATTTARLVPWSTIGGEPFAVESSSSFEVTGCGAPQFAPSFHAGSIGSSQAGAYTPLSVTFSRTDQDQQLGGITVHTPPGLLGSVANVTQCGEPQASQGACGPDSQIGTVSAAAGPGPSPFWITSGRAYLTGPYKGAPFGLSIVVPTVAGPFNLGEEHLRAAIFVDPQTGAISVVSDPLPTMKDGIPFQVKTVNVNINRPQFTFNATNCNAMAITGTISSTQGASTSVSSPYQAHGCASLPFSPELSIEVGGHGSKVNGTSFVVKVKATPGQANIAKTFLTLPVALPSRLDTIQKACRDTTFEANPASCGEGSNIGMAIVHTPLLKSPLVGPAYLVSHGNAAFPDVEFVLQGEGVTLVLDGKTDIKKGITYSRFETVPDAPVSTFEAILPAGPHSALTTYVPGADQYNLCNTSLVVPMEITGQNGAVIKKNTKVAISGCAASKPTVKVTRAKVKGKALLVTVSASAAGKVRISGRGLKTTTKTVAAGTHQIRVVLTNRGRSMHKHHKKTTVHVSLISGKQSATKAKSLHL